MTSQTSYIDPQAITLVIPWPRVPTMTPTGKVSRANGAGGLIPWLSANVVNNLPGPVYRNHKIAWKVATLWALADMEAAPHRIDGECEVSVRLYKATRSAMDPLAVLEGIKPCLDVVQDVLYANDRQVIGGRAVALKAESRDQCRVEITLQDVAG